MDPALKRALDFLNEHKIRATYKAIGEYMHLPTQSVGGELGRKCPLASWIVSSKTGMPTKYAPSECDPDLQVNKEIIKTGDELKLRMRLVDRGNCFDQLI
ncbi:MAG: hypothetical protein K9N10_22830 [Deltaproteobacteria bacterium]|nr:hypothetical protein [Deltaproteobacteria bacterium]